VITTASSGNAAAALAGMAAAVGLKAVIFVPETAPAAKVAQLLVFGARVFLVRGTYDQAFDLCLVASRHFDWYCRNTGYNPYTVEGKKTVSLEIAEQLGWQVPDRVVVSVGDGNIISGVWKGFEDLRQLGWIDRLPRLVGVQARFSDPLVTAWEQGTETIVPIDACTVADSICVGLPRDGLRALRGVRATDGLFMRVTDEQILAAIPRLAREAAVFAEPAGATAFAGLVQLAREGRLDPDERIVVIVTGSGLKDVAAAMRVAGEATRIEPTLEAVEEALAGVRLQE
jgi:threonine synthase